MRELTGGGGGLMGKTLWDIFSKKGNFSARAVQEYFSTALAMTGEEHKCL